MVWNTHVVANASTTDVCLILNKQVLAHTQIICEFFFTSHLTKTPVLLSVYFMKLCENWSELLLPIHIYQTLSVAHDHLWCISMKILKNIYNWYCRFNLLENGVLQNKSLTWWLIYGTSNTGKAILGTTLWRLIVLIVYLIDTQNTTLIFCQQITDSGQYSYESLRLILPTAHHSCVM